MSDSDRREKREGSSPVSPGRFGGDRPAWPSLHEDPPAPPATPAVPAPTGRPGEAPAAAATKPVPGSDAGRTPAPSPGLSRLTRRGRRAAGAAADTPDEGLQSGGPGTGASAVVPPVSAGVVPAVPAVPGRSVQPTASVPLEGSAASAPSAGPGVSAFPAGMAEPTSPTSPADPDAAGSPVGPVASGHPLAVFEQSGTGVGGELGDESGHDGPSDPAESADPAEHPANRRRLVLVLSIIAAVLVIGGGITTVLLLRDGGGGSTATPPGVVLPSPTATVAPVARTATTPFASTLPTTLLQYALASSADDEEWLALNALEAYAETYTDGAAATVTVQAGQWETPEEAAAVLAALVGELPAAVPVDSATADPAATSTATPGTPTVLLQESVEVAGQSSGSVTVVDAGDGTGVAVWNNGTTVFRLTGPAADIRNLYAAYPL